MRRAVSAFLVVLAVASCDGTDTDDDLDASAACTPPPDRVITDPQPVDDLGPALPPTFVVTPGAGTFITAGDLDGDGINETVEEDAEGRLSIVGTDVVLDDRFRQIWPDDLDGTPGHDFVQPDAGAGRTTVWSGAGALEGDLAPDLTLEGLVRTITPEGETLLLVPEPPAIRVAGHPEIALRVPDDTPSERVQQIVQFEDDGQRWVGLTVDRRRADWRWPINC